MRVHECVCYLEIFLYSPIEKSNEQETRQARHLNLVNIKNTFYTAYLLTFFNFRKSLRRGKNIFFSFLNFFSVLFFFFFVYPVNVSVDISNVGASMLNIILPFLFIWFCIPMYNVYEDCSKNKGNEKYFFRWWKVSQKFVMVETALNCKCFHLWLKQICIIWVVCVILTRRL